jgi:hypothetical protein
MVDGWSLTPEGRASWIVVCSKKNGKSILMSELD